MKQPKDWEAGIKNCSHDGCDKSFKQHKWGAIGADSEGWFMQKNGDSWCPDHNPEWVAEWRAKRNTFNA